MAKSKLIDLTGKVFDQLTVICRLANKPNGAPTWLCRCDCGNYRTTRGATLREKRMTNCGCTKRQRLLASTVKHGMHRTAIYKVWFAMIARCRNPNTHCYADYGGRGITVCDRWKNFSNFYADMGDCPKGMSLDRIDNDGNYEPGNCRWATRREQNLNRRNTLYVTAFGITKNVYEWSDEMGVDHSAIRTRLGRGKKNEQLFVCAWPQKSGKLETTSFITAFGETKSTGDWADQMFIPRTTLSRRVASGAKESELFVCLWPRAGRRKR